MCTVTSSAAAIFAYWWLVPAVLWVLFWRRGSTAGISFLEMICIYGYSLSIYIPVSVCSNILHLANGCGLIYTTLLCIYGVNSVFSQVLWVIQLTWLQWTLVAVAMCLSGSVLVLTFWPALTDDSRQVNNNNNNNVVKSLQLRTIVLII